MGVLVGLQERKNAAEDSQSAGAPALAQGSIESPARGNQRSYASRGTPNRGTPPRPRLNRTASA